MKIIHLIWALGFLANPSATEKGHKSTEESLILVVGGSDSYGDGVNSHRDAQIVDLSKQTRACTNLPEYPGAMGMATGAIVSGHPMICGSTSHPIHNAPSECYHYSKVSNSWIFLTNMTSPGRLYGGSVMIKGSLFLMGSYGTEYVYPDGNASRSGPDLPNSRDGLCAVKLSTGQVMILGGRPPYGGFKNSSSAIIFDPDTETFDKSLPSMRIELLNGACAVFKSGMHDNREVVLAAGGNHEATAELFDYTQPNATWTKIADLPFDHVHRWEYDQFSGANAVTSPSGKGVIVQHYKQLYELTCEITGCSWSILPQRLSPGVKFAVMMTLPPDYAC